MKNVIQIKRYLSDKTYTSEIDYKAISAYCLEEFNYKVPQPPQQGQPISCADFLNWIISGFRAGDVVKWGENLGIVYNSSPENIQTCFRTHGNTPIFDFHIVSIKDISKGDKNDSRAVYELLREDGKEFSYSILEIAPKYVPKNDDIVQFRAAQGGWKKLGYGVVKFVDADDVVMYCYVDGDETVHYSLDEHVGKLEDLQFEKIAPDSYGRKKLEECLKCAGKSWNHYMKRVEPEDMRVKPGKKYWYITDQMKVKAAVEDGKLGTVAHKRYLAGNYFRSPQEVMGVQADAADMLKKHLAEPGV